MRSVAVPLFAGVARGVSSGAVDSGLSFRAGGREAARQERSEPSPVELSCAVQDSQPASVVIRCANVLKNPMR